MCGQVVTGFCSHIMDSSNQGHCTSIATDSESLKADTIAGFPYFQISLLRNQACSSLLQNQACSSLEPCMIFKANYDYKVQVFQVSLEDI
jgi:hypothetical protein